MNRKGGHNATEKEDLESADSRRSVRSFIVPVPAELRIVGG